MRKIAKKLFTSIMVLAIILNYFMPIIVLANDIISAPTIAKTEMDESIPSKGNIEVELHLALPIHNREKSNITMTIADKDKNSGKIDFNDITTKAQDGIYTSNVKIGDQSVRFLATKRDKNGSLLSGVSYSENIVYFSINLYSLDRGTYTLTLSGKNFVTYSFDVTLKDFSQRISLSNELGLFEIGDVNGDNLVDEADFKLMQEAIAKNDKSYDLNLDGEVDIADLNYVTAMLYGTRRKLEREDTTAIIDSKDVTFDVPVEAIAEGSSDISSILSDEGVVRFQATEENPEVSFGIDLTSKNNSKAVEMSQIRVAVGDNVPKAMTFEIEVEGRNKPIVKNVTNESTQGIHKFTDDATAGSIVVDLGSQVAVKKVTINITEMTNNLADIAKVEFLNNVKVETKAPTGFGAPKNLKIDGSQSEQLTVNFQHATNVTGYEIEITGGKLKEKIFQTTYNTFTIEDLDNYTTYKIRVRSVNQEWRSDWVEATGTPTATRVPPAVDMVKAVPTFSAIEFSWKDMKDTKTYNLYYREKGTDAWIDIREISGTSYRLSGLKASVTYEAYLTGNNDLGEGSKSQVVEAKTLKADATIAPKYNLINDFNSDINRTNHIKDVIYSLGTMSDDNKYAIVDDNYLTYYEVKDWQVSAHYYNINSPITVLDKVYQMDEIVLTVPDSFPNKYKSGTYDTNASNKNDILVHYWNSVEERTADNKTTVQATMQTRQDENKRTYYVIKLQDPISADAIQLGLTIASGNSIQIDELKFYKYDSLVDDVAALFTDDLRISLKEDVTQDKIDELRKRADNKDNGEYSPYRDSVLADLDYAEKILKDEKLDDIITLDPNYANAYNGHLKFAMSISDYQPLGIVARPGETLNVYVGTNSNNVNAEIVFTQFYAEANAWNATASQTLQKGLNVITVPTIGSAAVERGGSVYIRYKNKPDNNPIRVRVSGGTKIPVLDTTGLNASDKKAAIQKYIGELKDFNASLPGLYQAENKTFDKATSVLSSTEIVTEHGLLSVSSMAVEDALVSGADTIEAQIDRLDETTLAFDEMMEMFYRQKGLQRNAADPADEMPKARINIRYMRMFDGAFMYAGGYHIGIGYGSIAGLIQAHRNREDATGYFGWGISHEIGHQINQSSTVFAEVTNNIYALLAQTSNDNDKSRLEINDIYDKIYEKVTSHTLGRAQNVFVQLGMYWQLHLAYDDEATFADTNSILARINHISRTYDNKNKYGRDDLTILFASMAANKNLIPFFEAWGLKASDKVAAEIAELGYETETKALYYLNDAARRYRLNTNIAIAPTTKVEASIGEVNNADKRVSIEFKTNGEANRILGYEILRNGESIAFVTGDKTSYIDNIGAENNRAYTYSVVAYDYLLNKTEATVLDEVKVSHDGSIKKDLFTIESNVSDENESIDFEDDTMDYGKLSNRLLIDDDNETAFNGTKKVKNLTHKLPKDVNASNAYIMLNLNDVFSISGIKYRAKVNGDTIDANTIGKYKVYVSSDAENWILANSGTFDLNKDNDYTNTVYFMQEGTTSKTQLWTYDNVSYVLLVSDGKTSLSGSELNVIAPPGDNIDISLTSDNTPVMGILDYDYCYLTDGCTEKDEKGETIGLIKAGSVIIKGSYTGSPSFNVLLLGDADDINKNYAGYQLLFAELNADNSVYDVAKGTWLYVMTQEEYTKMYNGSKAIRAYLYRVNDAIENKGQRLTSTSKAVTELVEYGRLGTMSITSGDVNKED